MFMRVNSDVRPPGARTINGAPPYTRRTVTLAAEADYCQLNLATHRLK
jgi:hypothetical protein